MNVVSRPIPRDVAQEWLDASANTSARMADMRDAEKQMELAVKREKEAYKNIATFFGDSHDPTLAYATDGRLLLVQKKYCLGKYVVDIGEVDVPV